jgi:hypothetical protein
MDDRRELIIRPSHGLPVNPEIVPDIIGEKTRPVFAIRDRIKAALAVKARYSEQAYWWHMDTRPWRHLTNIPRPAEAPPPPPDLSDLIAQFEQMQVKLRADDRLLEMAITKPAPPIQIIVLVTMMARQFTKWPAHLDHYAAGIRDTLASPPDLSGDAPPPITEHALSLAITKLRHTCNFVPSAAEFADAYESAHDQLIELRRNLEASLSVKLEPLIPVPTLAELVKQKEENEIERYIALVMRGAVVLVEVGTLLALSAERYEFSDAVAREAQRRLEAMPECADAWEHARTGRCEE